MGSLSRSGPVASTNKLAPNMVQRVHARNGGLPPVPVPYRKHQISKAKWVSGPFRGCIMGGAEPPILQSCVPMDDDTRRSSASSSIVGKANGDAIIASSTAYFQMQGRAFSMNLVLSLIDSKRRLMNAPPSTLGAAGLALHYANVVVVIEKLVASPHLIGPDARDDLYRMLTASIRAGLRARLKSCAKNFASFVYDPVLAAEWSEAITRILEWLSPLARNMIRWQSERSFEQQHMVSNTNVLLLQTLYFANQVKTEAAITELLVGLNYLWRFGRELNAKAILECLSSRNFDDFRDLKV